MELAGKYLWPNVGGACVVALVVIPFPNHNRCEAWSSRGFREQTSVCRVGTKSEGKWQETDNESRRQGQDCSGTEETLSGQETR